MFVLLFLLFSTSLENPIVFDTTLTCNKEHIGPNGWCAEGFFVEVDHWSPDDAVHYFLKCSKNETIHVESNATNPDGDEWGFRHKFDYIVFHNCDSKYYDHLLEDGNVNSCICDPTRKPQITVHPLQCVHTIFNFSEETTQRNSDNRCKVPDDFTNVKLHSGNAFPTKGCSWKGYEQQEIKWSLSK